MADILEGKRVLIVEDEFLLALALEGDVNDLGGEVLGPAGRLAAVEALMAGGATDAAILDVELDHETSTDLARRLNAAGIAVVLVAGASGEPLPADLVGTPLLTKPITGPALRAALQRAFAGQH